MKAPLFAALLLAHAAHAQLVRQPNSTLVLPATLPNATGYTTENALGALTFASPIDVAVPPGVTDRLYVVERGGTIQRVNLTTLTKSTFLNLSAYLTAQGTPLNTGIESGFLSIAFHPQYNQNGFVFVFYSVTIGGQFHQRVARFTATGTAGNFNAATTLDTTTHQPLITPRTLTSRQNFAQWQAAHFPTPADPADPRRSRPGRRRPAQRL